MALQREEASANAAASAMITEDDACIAAVINMLTAGWISVLMIKTPRPAALGKLPWKSGGLEASV
jgi:hypothetical protein